MKMFKNGMILLLPVAFLLILSIAPACGQEADTVKKVFQPRFYIYIGAYSPNISTTFSLDGNKTPGTVLSLENDLNFDSRPWLIRFDGMAHFTKRSGLSLAFMSINRNSQHIIDRDINIRDTTFHIGAELNVYFNTIFYSASYNYFVFSHPQWRAGLSVGVRFLVVKIGVNLEATNVSGYAENVAVPAPSPVLGINGSAYMTKRLQVKYNLDYFNISVKGMKAGVLDNRIALEYYFIKNVGIGGSLNYLYYRVREIPIRENLDGEFRYALSGFSLYAAVRF
jgi:hypothetical protein